MAVNLAQFESVLARPGPVDVVSTGESGENVKPIELKSKKCGNFCDPERATRCYKYACDYTCIQNRFELNSSRLCMSCHVQAFNPAR